jgi:hypothetical protein
VWPGRRRQGRKKINRKRRCKASRKERGKRDLRTMAAWMRMLPPNVHSKEKIECTLLVIKKKETGWSRR